MPGMPRSTADLAAAAVGQYKERELAAVLLSSSPYSRGDVFIWPALRSCEKYLLFAVQRTKEFTLQP